MPCTKSLPIMLALCSMLLPSYYAPNYAGIIGSGLVMTVRSYKSLHFSLRNSRNFLETHMMISSHAKIRYASGCDTRCQILYTNLKMWIFNH